MVQRSWSLYCGVLCFVSVFNWTSSLENIESEENCGIPAVSGSQPRIVNGDDASSGQYPWQALLLKTIGGKTGAVCGGTLINSRWVVTAAHCLNGESSSQLEVFLGVNNITTNDEDGRQRIGIRSYICHEDYESSTFAHDICLLELENAASHTNFVRPACLPSVNTIIPPGTSCTISGWGRTTEGGQTSDVLQHAQVDIIDRSTCTAWYTGVFNIPEDHICAGFAEGGTDTCQGDSGGPLVCQENDSNGVSRYVLRGVTSFGDGCARAERPGLYTQTVKYIDWISEAIPISSSISQRVINNVYVLILLFNFAIYLSDRSYA